MSRRLFAVETRPRARMGECFDDTVAIDKGGQAGPTAGKGLISFRHAGGDPDPPPVPFYGAVAQSVERVNGIHEVRGSIPLGSTMTDTGVARSRCRSSAVEHPLGKGEVGGSMPPGSTITVD